MFASLGSSAAHAAAPQPPAGRFCGAAPNQSTLASVSLFGAAPNQTRPTSGCLFGAASNQTRPASGGLFGATLVYAAASQPGAESIFGATNQSKPVFVAASTTGFDAAYANQ